MTRYIDADALKEFIESAYRPLCDDYHMKDYVLNQILTDIKNAPTIDAVPVIRCKDCKWYYRGGATCMFWDGANGMCGDDFCGKAERAEE